MSKILQNLQFSTTHFPKTHEAWTLVKDTYWGSPRRTCHSPCGWRRQWWPRSPCGARGCGAFWARSWSRRRRRICTGGCPCRWTFCCCCYCWRRRRRRWRRTCSCRGTSDSWARNCSWSAGWRRLQFRPTPNLAPAALAPESTRESPGEKRATFLRLLNNSHANYFHSYFLEV